METEDILEENEDDQELEVTEIENINNKSIYLSEGTNRQSEEILEENYEESDSLIDYPEQGFSFKDRDFKMGVPWFLRVFMVHMTWMAHILQKNIINLNNSLDFNHIPNLQKEEKVDKKCEEIQKFLEKFEKENQVEGRHILRMIISIFKKDFILSNILTALSKVIKPLNSIFIYELVQQYASDGPEKAIKWAILIFCTLIIESCLKSQSFNSTKQLSAKIRLTLISLVYQRTSSLTKNQIQKSNIGKLFNMISYDLNTMESMLYFLLVMVYVPLFLLVAGVIIYWRIGYYGLIGILIIALTLPVQVFLGFGSKEYLQLKNKNSDQRIKIIHEIIEGVRQMKMYGLEEIFIKRVNEERKKELNSISGVQYYRTTNKACSISFSLLAGFLPILLMYLDHSNNLNTAIVFSTLDLFYGLKSHLFLAGIGISFSFELGLMLNRFAEFLRFKNESMIQVSMDPEQDKQQQEEYRTLIEKQQNLLSERYQYQIQNPKTKINEQNYEQSPEELDLLSKQDSNQRYIIGKSNESTPENLENQFEFLNLSTLWDIKNPNFGLKEITVNIKKGFHYGLVGKIGSGKSTFLQAILGEVPYCLGELRKIGTLSYVEQEPYIFAGNIRDNILFGKQYDPIFYDEVISACCLKDDFDQLIDGDETEVGEKGVTLSGGQRSRISLARAVYSKNDTYLLDDPLSSVDPKVAEQLSQNLFSGILKGKTVILATHQLYFTQFCDEILIFSDGKIVKKLKYNELSPTQHEISKNIVQLLPQQEHEDQIKKANFMFKSPHQLAIIKSARGNCIEKENSENFKVSIKTYQRYCSQTDSWTLVIGTLMLFIFCELLYTGFYYYLGSFDRFQNKYEVFKMASYFLIGFIIVCFLKYYCTIWMISQANLNMHNDMFSSIVRVPISYFDTTSTGKIISRFSTDLGSVDMILPYLILDCMELFFQILNIMITVSIFNPWISIPIILLILLPLKYLLSNQSLQLQSKSLDYKSKYPIYSQFATTIQGIIQIRIQKQIERFFQDMFDKANNSIRSNFLFWNVISAFSFNIQIITITISFIAIIICMFSKLSPNYLGQTIIFLIILIDQSFSFLRQIPNLEVQMLQIERMQQITRLQSEDYQLVKEDTIIVNNQIRNSCKEDGQVQIQIKGERWNVRGKIEFNQVFMKYREDLDYSISQISFKVNQGESVGFVGRTGAGKSSIVSALLRIKEISKGNIFIDDIDINTVGLHTLRKAISIIPQVPFIFPGSIRFNIDPLSEYSDQEIYHVLELIQLREFITSFPQGLFEEVSNGSFSTGQKQLLCLAQAILRKSNILIQDEATSNIDCSTDQFIQDIIRRIFRDSTILTIAHRLNTIADYDKIIVMDEGKVVEFNSPYLLLVNQVGDNKITSSSIFAQMVLATGLNNATIIFKISQEHYLNYNIKNT